MNIPAIVSEGGRNTRRELILEWIDENGETGQFVRDEGSPFDCSAMMPEVFDEIYLFASLDDGSLFRRIVRK